MITEFLIDLGRAGVSWIWLPTIVWTALVGLILAILRAARGLHPLSGYRLRQALLFALPTTALLTPLMPSGANPVTLSIPAMRALPGLGEAVTQRFPGTPDLLGVWIGVVTLAVLLLALGHVVLLLRHLVALARLRATSVVVEEPVPLELLEELTERLHVKRAVVLRKGPPDCVPMTFHALEPSIVVPSSLLHNHSALRIALTHELIHVRRGDYAWAVSERVVAAAFAFHPLVWGLRRSVEHFRESSCDAEIIASGITPPRAYAQLLCDLSGRAPLRLGIAAGMATHTSNLKQRLETMKRFTEVPTSRPLRRWSSVSAVSLLLGTALLGACAGQESEPAPYDYEVGVAITSQFGDLTEGARDVALERLEVQLDYLADEIEGLTFTFGREESQRSSHRVQSRYTLLNELYIQRLRTFELLLLEAETDQRLGS